MARSPREWTARKPNIAIRILPWILIIGSLLILSYSRDENEIDDVEINLQSLTEEEDDIESDLYQENDTSNYETSRLTLNLRTQHDNLFGNLTGSNAVKESWEEGGLKCHLVFVKIAKCASSTVGGVARRIASNHYREFRYRGIKEKTSLLRSSASSSCTINAGHTPRPEHLLQITNQNQRDKTLLFSFIRLPDDRVLSQYFHFRVSRHGYNSDDGTVLYFMRKIYKNDFMIKWLANYISQCKGISSLAQSQSCIQRILEEYDFIGLVERIDESLVVFKILNKLSFSDILHVGSSKTNGGFDDHGYKILPTVRSEKVDAFLKTKYSSEDHYDMQLYSVVNKTLDRTIEKIGREEVETQVKQYRQLLKEVKQFCSGQVFFPYSAQGKYQKVKSRVDCYWNDNGCGVPCLNDFAKSDIYRNIVDQS